LAFALPPAAPSTPRARTDTCSTRYRRRPRSLTRSSCPRDAGSGSSFGSIQPTLAPGASVALGARLSCRRPVFIGSVDPCRRRWSSLVTASAIGHGPGWRSSLASEVDFGPRLVSVLRPTPSRRRRRPGNGVLGTFSSGISPVSAPPRARAHPSAPPDGAAPRWDGGDGAGAPPGRPRPGALTLTHAAPTPALWIENDRRAPRPPPPPPPAPPAPGRGGRNERRPPPPPAPPRRTARRVVVRAEEAAAAAPAPEEPKPWVAPTLDPNTPSPIFGGSTGGLLRKAQVSGAGDALGGQGWRGEG